MTLRLINAYTSQNLGDAAIYETLVQLAGPLGASASLTAARARHVRGLQGTGAPAQAWVGVGGDIFNNARPAWVTRRFLELVRELSGNDPRRSFVFGQGLPSSCRGAALSWLARTMRRLSSVTVRDASSHERLRAVGVRAELGYDTVFAYEPGSGVQAAGQALWELAGMDPARAVLFSVREFDAMYPHDGARFEGRLVTLLQSLRQRGHEPALVIQAQADGADSDREVLARLRQQVGHLPVLDPFDIALREHHPLDALLGVLGQAAAVLAVRYHTAVLRMLAGRQPYNLYYSTKGHDLVQRLGVPGQSLADFEPDALVLQIEASIDKAFDPAPIARMVRSQFQAALRTALFHKGGVA